MGKKNQHVTPHSNGGWQVKGEGNVRATVVTPTQREAIEAARDLARKFGSEVVIHGTDGKIRDKDSYGIDPNPPEDKKH